MNNNWTDTIFLLRNTPTKDEDGFHTYNETRTPEIPACFKSITRQESEHSRNFGYTADLVVEILSANYNQENFLINGADNKRYSIRRIFPISPERVQLTCSDLSKIRKDLDNG